MINAPITADFEVKEAITFINCVFSNCKICKHTDTCTNKDTRNGDVSANFPGATLVVTNTLESFIDIIENDSFDSDVKINKLNAILKGEIEDE